MFNQNPIVHSKPPSFIIRSKVVVTYACSNVVSTCVDKKYFSVDFFVLSL